MNDALSWRLNGKTAWVCGSTQGIGEACARIMAERGATVVLVARDEGKLKSLASQLAAEASQEHRFVVADFADSTELSAAAQRHLRVHPDVHILVNNTGGPPAGSAYDATLDQFAQAFHNHVLCNQVLVQAVVPAMQREKYGRVINIISTSVKQPIPGLGVSNTIRAAVANWAKTLSAELGPLGITVNNVLPGMTETARLAALIAGRAQKSGETAAAVAQAMKAEIPARRFATAAEIAAAVAFLACPAASYINGINLPVDGGRTQSL